MQLMQVFIYCKLLYMFRVSITPIIGVHQNVTAASDTGHSTRSCSYSLMYS